MKRKLTKTGKRRRLIVNLIEVALVTALLLCVIYALGWVVARAQEPLGTLLDGAAKAVIG